VTPGSPSVSLAALLAALAATGPAGPPDGGWAPRLVRHGSHAVYVLAGAPAGPRLVARVGADGPGEREEAGLALRVARWLADAGFPAVRAVADGELAVPQPVAAQGHLVTFWHALGDHHGTTADLGGLLRRFHALDLPADLVPAPMDPVGRVRRQVGASTALGDADRAFLTDRLDAVAARYARLDLPLPPGHLHGDATVANVVLDAAGRPALVDLDLVRTGPREWDLVRTAVSARRLGWHTEEEYRRFAGAYGHDVAALPGFDVLADLTELLQVAWLADAATSRPHLAPELAARITSLREDTTRRTWQRI